MGDDRKKVRLVRLFFEGGLNEGGLDELEELEAERRGYRSHVWAELDNGRRHQLTFYDVTRLSQTLDDECASGRMFFAEPGLVVLPAVTLAHMEAAAGTLASEGFFPDPAGDPTTADPASKANRT